MTPGARNCLVISYGPVPTTEHRIVEGGGLRCWGLAQGLRDNGVDVTVAVHDSYPQTLESHEGIPLCNWNLSNGFDKLLGRFDAVLVSYCMGDLSETVASTISDDTYLVLDLYVPIYLEIPARDSDDAGAEYQSYMTELKRWNRVLERGDHFICANSGQQQLYTGVLGAVGRVNPLTYREDILEVVPFGVEDSPRPPTAPAFPRQGPSGPSERGAQGPSGPSEREAQGPSGPSERGAQGPSETSEFVLLWFGGLYPWFDIRSLFDAVEELSCDGLPLRVLVVGGRNPFTSHPDFTKHYEEAVAYCRERRILDRLVHFQDWVEYEDRAAWYASADAVISLNRPGTENAYSWRTRLMDYVWAELPVITNGGDALSELLIERNAAVRIDISDTAALGDAIRSLSTGDRLARLERNVAVIKKEFAWRRLTEGLASRLAKAARPSDSGLAGLPALAPLPLPDPTPSLATRLLDKVALVPRVARAQGLEAAGMVAAQQLKNLTTRFPRPKRYIFLAHQLDNSGAPVVLIDMARDVASRVGPGNVRVVSFPPVSFDNRRQLDLAGIELEILDHSWANLAIHRDDFVLLNTISIRKEYLERVLGLLDTGKLGCAYWYIHEDEPAHNFMEDRAHRVKNLMNLGRLVILVPGKQAYENYARYFSTQTGVRQFNYRFNIDSSLAVRRSADNFTRLDFHLTGTASDSRKGHESVLFAFERLLGRVDIDDPRYRDFTLNFIGMGEDFFSRQVLRLAPQVLGHRFASTGKTGRREALDKMSHCNVALCYSVRECLPLYIQEGMFLGHVILRNDCSGVDEQLEDGGNGYLLDSLDIDQVASTLELVLDTKATSGERLALMSRRSQEMVEDSRHLTYWDRLFGDHSQPG